LKKKKRWSVEPVTVGDLERVVPTESGDVFVAGDWRVDFSADSLVWADTSDPTLAQIVLSSSIRQNRILFIIVVISL
jgi:hypothetical protein